MNSRSKKEDENLLVTYRSLTNKEFPAALAIRIKVFVEEQHVPLEEEHDSFDQIAQHFGVFQASTLIGTGRLLFEDRVAKIGRIAILKEFRDLGLGRALLQAIIAAGQEQGYQEFVLGSQLQALDFYEKLGFRAEGSIFQDGGIPHRQMRLDLGKEGDE